MEKTRIEDIKDTHLVGLISDYNEAEKDIAELVDEVERLQNRVDAAAYEREQLLDQIKDSRTGWRRMIEFFLKKVQAPDFSTVERRYDALVSLAKASIELTKLSVNDIDLGAWSELGSLAREEFFNAINNVEELNIPDVKHGNAD